MPLSSRIWHAGIQYTPVDSMTTVLIPQSISHSAILFKSAVNVSKRRTGYNLAPETGAWIIGDGESLPFRKFPRRAPGLKHTPQQIGYFNTTKRTAMASRSIHHS